MLSLTLTADDVATVNAITAEISARFTSVEDPRFHRECQVYAQELPRWLRSALNDFRLTEPSGILLLSGLPVDEAVIGPTPADWRTKPAASTTVPYDVPFFLFSCLLGEPIGWATQQDGRIMHDIFPMAGHKDDQIGWGSEQTLTWHTEDAFHPLRTDYLALMCLRNPDGVETTAADIADVELADDVRRVLGDELFEFVPDDSHRAQNQVDDGAPVDPAVAELLRRSRDRVERALASPERASVLFGSPEQPYLRLDPEYMRQPRDPRARWALDTISDAIDKAMTGVVLQPGDVCFIDNYRVVHGRKPFRARFDGTDRWLRRLNITRDLRKSRQARLTADSRVIY